MADARHGDATSIAKVLEPRMRRDRQLLQQIYASFDAGTAPFTKADAEQLSKAIEQEQKLLDTIVDGGQPRASRDLVGAAARRVVRNQLVTLVPAARKVARLNAENIAQVYGVLRHHAGGVFDPTS